MHFPNLGLQPRDHIQRKNNSKNNLTKISEQKKWSTSPMEVLFQNRVNEREKKSFYLWGAIK